MFTTKRECEMKKVRAKLASLVLALGVRSKADKTPYDRIEAALAAVHYGVAAIAAIGAVALVLALVASAAYLGLL